MNNLLNLLLSALNQSMDTTMIVFYYCDVNYKFVKEFYPSNLTKSTKIIFGTYELTNYRLASRINDYITCIYDLIHNKLNKQFCIKKVNNGNNNPKYILDLLLGVISVSIQTMEIVDSLPKVTFD